MADLIKLLEDLEGTSSRKAKEALVSSADERCQLLFKRAMDPYETFGLQNISLPDAQEVTSWDIDPLLDQLHQILDALRDRELVGNEARLIVNQFLLELPAPVAKWFHRVVLKDLRCGVTAKTINKIFPGLVPSFTVQLAEELRIVEDKLKPAVSFPVWADVKLDGLRCITIKDKGQVTIYSRGGHVIDALPTIAKLIQDIEADNFVLDGEAMARSWNESQSVVFSTVNRQSDEGMFYNVFDYVPLDDWKSQNCQMRYLARREEAKKVVCAISDTRIRVVGGVIVDSKEALMHYFHKTLREGHEGIMIKDPEANYQFKRSKAVMKLKPFSTWEGTIIGWNKGNPNSKWENGFGGFLVEFDGVVTEVGGGFTDEQRVSFFQQLQLNSCYYDLKVVEVKGKEKTPDGKIREPVFIRFRVEEDT